MNRYFLSMIKCTFLLSHFFVHESFGNILQNTPKIRVCVIGAGPSGIKATKHLAENLDKFEITTFERSFDVGGNWAFTNETGVDKYGYPIHSSIYKNLRTNTPKELTNFPDFPDYKGVNTSTVPHYIILEYLKNYTDHFQLKQFIQFHSFVENVKLVNKNGLDEWKVKVKNVKTSEINEYIFDAVVVCNGHYSVPNIPHIPGLKDFEGKVLHSHDYKEPEPFKNKTVIILGGNVSGYEIGLDLLNVTSKVYMSHNKQKKRYLLYGASSFLRIPVNLKQVEGIDKFENGKFILKDNSSMIADVLLFCTGYNYVFPFLDNSSGIIVDNNYISPLYKMLINIEHPSMSFIGIPQGPPLFTVIHSQAEFVTKFLKGEIKLPSKNEMLEDSKLKTSKKRDAYRYLNLLNYNDDLASLGGLAPIPYHYKVGFRDWVPFWLDHLGDYRDYNLVFSDDKMSVKFVKST